MNSVKGRCCVLFSFPTKNVAGLLFLLRRLTRRGRNAACGQCPASGGHGTGAFTAPGWRR
ncbi:hypothetical protein DWC96_20140 [Salmonella enterica]|uniref:Uncharacterized protein n=5 Tax=Enterobacteriaceae TaxID=543 RepID=A0A826J5J8_ECOLX|nr:hypothetical protein [Escherichia coli]EAN0132379.1 hypothetical protein [Salmonella enterica]EBM9427858.1 hypothetical protein [Salmonella enterica subsp. enterica serovar Heidelberg]EBR8153495.1 hypothetical protein [Salmonella enterica subsp. enterica serovar Enteritidis]EBU8888285.1 hypothetical protein [Salmonella enterica subsp. enterica serovar Coeln]EBW6924995.1 hypothetical protein [Salmonella enterica subsp. enterica serovar Java]ECD2688842.1 hypothetical protein [Salmonella ente